MHTIPVYQPYLSGNEKTYVAECLNSNWISSKGGFISRFENAFAEYIGAENATSVCNGTVALHLAMCALDIGPGDEVIVASLTYIASVNTIAQTGAVPVFVDSLSQTLQMDPCEIRKKISHRTKAIMAVHLYGHPCDMDSITKICEEFNLLLIEDCAEAFGTYYQGKHVGIFGDVATFSFFGNKTITTGEGGMVISKAQKTHVRCCHLKSQGVSTEKEYWHDELAYNYRMTNICAAIGLAQLEQAEKILSLKRRLAEKYRDGLSHLPLSFHSEAAGTINSYWMCSIVLDAADQRDGLRKHLQQAGIETRPFFYPAHKMPVFQEEAAYPIAEKLGASGINLPSWPDLSEDQSNHVITSISKYFSR